MLSEFIFPLNCLCDTNANFAALDKFSKELYNENRGTIFEGVRIFMNWNDIKKNISEITGKAARKTEELANLAEIKIRIAKLSSEKENEFLRLGKLTYKKLTTEDETLGARLTQKISDTVDKIAELEDKIAVLSAEYEQKKQEAEAKKQAKKAKESEFGEDEINTEVLDSFADNE